MLNFAFKHIEAHIEEKCFHKVVLPVVKRIRLLQILFHCEIRILPELMVLMQVRESLQLLALVTR